NAFSIYRVAAYTGGSNYFFRTDLPAGVPNGTINQAYYTTADAFPTSTSGARWPFVDLVYTVANTQPVSISPTSSGTFNHGSWSGTLTVMSPAPAVILLANDGTGHSGSSSPFLVGPNTIGADGAALLAESCSPANGGIDPGERVRVNLGLRNNSATTLNNVVATL